MLANHRHVDYALMYDEYWNRPDRYGSHSFDDPKEIVEEILRASGPCRALDIGCGMGGLVLSLLRSGFDAMGVDISPVAINYAKRVAPNRYMVASSLALPFTTDSFSTVVSTDFLEHLHETDIAQALSEMWRICSDTLYLRISTTADRDTKWHLTVKPREWWEKQLILSGFRKHPCQLDVIGYEEIEREGYNIKLVMQKIPSAVRIRYPLNALLAERDLHMDMTREAGRRSDAHTVRYKLARQFVRPGDTVLDFACGLGYGTCQLAYGSGAAHLIGVDNNRYAITYAETNFGSRDPRLEFRCGDAVEMRWLDDESIDYVVSMETLEHLPNPARFLTEIHRVLKPSGRIIVSVPHMWVDETGCDPNPHHLHVYDLKKLREQIDVHFILEIVWAQTAGGGFKFPQAERTLRVVDAKTDDSMYPDSEWWLCLAMKSPITTSTSRYLETVNQSGECSESHVVDFASWYDNPYLYHGLINRGCRLQDPVKLSLLARDVIATSKLDSADCGGALCVLAYQFLDDSRSVSSLLASNDQADELLDLNRKIEDFIEIESENPHIIRWQISLTYVQGLLLRAQGDLPGAKNAFTRCMAMDPLIFSPLIATKTLTAGLALAELELGREERTAAHFALTRALQTAITVVGRDWPNVVGNTEKPFIFGFLELRDVCNLAAKCALVMEALERGWTKPFAYARRQIAESNQGLTERDSQIAALNERLAKRDSKVAERDSKVAERDSKVAERDSQIAALNEGLAKRDNQIANIHSSRSWRLTRPLRGIKLVFTGARSVRWPTRYLGIKLIYLTRRFLFHARSFGLRSACRRAGAVVAARVQLVNRRSTKNAELNPVAVLQIASVPHYGMPEKENQCPPVAMLVEDFHDGGLEKVVGDIANQFLRQGIICPILAVGSAGRAAKLAEEVGCKVQAFNGDIAKLESVVRENGIEVLIVHHCYQPLEELSRHGVKVVEVIHNAYSWQRDLSHLADLRGQCVDSFVAVSDFVRDYALAALSIPADRIRVIENGLSRHGLIRPPLRNLYRRRKATVDRPLLVHLANAHPQKNHIAILRAFENILPEFPDASLVLAGAVDESTEIGRRVHAEIERRCLHGHVRCSGPLERREVSRLLADAHVGLLPSVFEGFSIASLEYTYFGLPTVLSDTGAARRLADQYEHIVIADAIAFPPQQLEPARIEHQGTNPDPSTVAGITAAVHTVLTNYDRFAEKAQRAGEDWETYSIESVARQYRSLLMETVA